MAETIREDKFLGTSYKMEGLAEILKANRPGIKPVTLKTYVSALRSIYRMSNPTADMKAEVPFSFFEDYDAVMSALASKKSGNRRTYLCAVVVLLNSGEVCEKYRKAMIGEIKKHEEVMEGQEMSERQEENWLTREEIKNKWDGLYKEVEGMFKRGKKREEANMRKLVNFMLLSVAGGIFFPPRRSRDWCELKVRNVDKKVDNWVDMKRGEFVFNQHKNDVRGAERVAFPKEFKSLLSKYLKATENDWLVFNTYGGQLSNVQVTQYLNGVFGGKHVSTTMLRHVYVTESVGDMPSLAELRKDAADMGHSLEMHIEYVKKPRKAKKSQDSV